jgi:hypothetical protein
MQYPDSSESTQGLSESRFASSMPCKRNRTLSSISIRNAESSKIYCAGKDYSTVHTQGPQFDIVKVSNEGQTACQSARLVNTLEALIKMPCIHFSIRKRASGCRMSNQVMWLSAASLKVQTILLIRGLGSPSGCLGKCGCAVDVEFPFASYLPSLAPFLGPFQIQHSPSSRRPHT